MLGSGSTRIGRPYPGRTVPQRLWERSTVLPNGCWQMTGYLSDGYARVKVNGRYKPAHKAMYEAVVGPVPPGLTLDHLCRNRACVNPAHLEPVTRAVNFARGESPSAISIRTGRCPRCGNERNTANTYIDPNGKRQCRPCRRRREAGYVR